MAYSTKIESKYNSMFSIAAGVEDFSCVIRYFEAEVNGHHDRTLLGGRTSEASRQYENGWRSVLFNNMSEKESTLLKNALLSNDFNLNEKFFILFLQMVAKSTLFHDITKEVLVKLVFSGRTTISRDDVLSYMRYLKTNEPEDMPWSETTMIRTAGMYLIVLSKLGLCEGETKNMTKELKIPYLSDMLFEYFIRWAQTVYPDKTIHNPYLPFSFLDNQILTLRLKKVEFMSVWDIYQLGSEITIEIK